MKQRVRYIYAPNVYTLIEKKLNFRFNIPVELITRYTRAINFTAPCLHENMVYLYEYKTGRFHKPYFARRYEIRKKMYALVSVARILIFIHYRSKIILVTRQKNEAFPAMIENFTHVFKLFTHAKLIKFLKYLNIKKPYFLNVFTSFTSRLFQLSE